MVSSTHVARTPASSKQRLQVRGVRALGQPEATLPVLAEARAVSVDAGLDLGPHARIGGEQRQHRMRGRGGPLRVRGEGGEQVAAALAEAL